MILKNIHLKWVNAYIYNNNKDILTKEDSEVFMLFHLDHHPVNITTR